MQEKQSEKLKQAKILIWDEIYTIRREYIEAIDRYLRELFNTNEFFGGLIVVFAGDPRKTLPKVKHNHSRGTITDTIFKQSHLYHFFTLHTLKQNIRLKDAGKNQATISKIRRG